MQAKDIKPGVSYRIQERKYGRGYHAVVLAKGDPVIAEQRAAYGSGYVPYRTKFNPIKVEVREDGRAPDINYVASRHVIETTEDFQKGEERTRQVRKEQAIAVAEQVAKTRPLADSLNQRQIDAGMTHEVRDYIIGDGFKDVVKPLVEFTVGSNGQLSIEKAPGTAALQQLVEAALQS